MLRWTLRVMGGFVALYTTATITFSIWRADIIQSIREDPDVNWCDAWAEPTIGNSRA